MPTLAESIESTSKSFLRGYVEASQSKNMQLLSTYVTADCRRYIGPTAFLVPKGLPPDFSMTHDEYAAAFNDMGLYEFYNSAVHDLVVDTHHLKSALRAELFAEFYDGEKASRNLIWFLDFNQDGSKIVRMYQQNDTEEANNWLEKIKARKEGKQ